MFFIVHPLRKVAIINVVFIQSRVFYRTSVAEGLYLTISGKVVFGVRGLQYLGLKNRYLSTEVNRKTVESGALPVNFPGLGVIFGFSYPGSTN